MVKQKGYKLAKTDHIVGCWCETAAGSGWSNYFIKVVVADKYHKLRIEWIQPNEMTRDMVVLFNTGDALHSELKRHVTSTLEGKK